MKRFRTEAILLLVLVFTLGITISPVIYKICGYEVCRVAKAPHISIEDLDAINERSAWESVEVPPLKDEWEVFRQALINVESGGDPYVVNSRSGAYGLYQIMKNGYLARYNQLMKTDYKMKDLEDVELQHKIFDKVQENANPGKDFKRALTIHNPRAMKPNHMSDYEYRVMYWFYRLEYEKLKFMIEDSDIKVLVLPSE